MLGVARRAAGQLDLLTDECHHGVIGDATFTWTIVVQDIAQAKLTLLHEFLSSGR